MTETTLRVGGTDSPAKGLGLLSGTAKWAVRIAIGIAVFWLLIIIFRFETIRWIYSQVALWLSVNFDLGDQFASLLAMALTALSIPLIPYVTAFLVRGQQSGAVTVIVLIVVAAAFGLLFAFGGEVFFTDSGDYRRCWAITPAGIKLVARSAESKKCPIERTYNIQTHPMTSDIAPSVIAARKGIKPTPISPEDVSRGGYFDTATGKAKVWFKQNRNRTFDLFDGPGFHQKTQQPLEPATPKNVEAIEEYVILEVQRAEQRRRQEDAERKRQAAESERSAAEEKAAQVRRATEEKAAQDRRALGAYNQADLEAATRQQQSGNLLAAAQHVNAVLARDPSNTLARDYYANWSLARVCNTCGVVTRRWEDVIDGTSVVPGAVVGGAVGYAAGTQVGGGRGREVAPVIGAVAGALLGNLISRKTLYRVEVRMDTGSSAVYSFVDHVALYPGQRVVVAVSGQNVNITPQP